MSNGISTARGRSFSMTPPKSARQFFFQYVQRGQEPVLSSLHDSRKSLMEFTKRPGDLQDVTLDFLGGHQQSVRRIVNDGDEVWQYIVGRGHAWKRQTRVVVHAAPISIVSSSNFRFDDIKQDIADLDLNDLLQFRIDPSSKNDFLYFQDKVEYCWRRWRRFDPIWADEDQV